MKKFHSFAAAALAVGAAATLAGCGGFIGCNSCSGCSGSSKNIALTSSNWFTDGYSGIQPSFIVSDENGAPTDYAEYKEIMDYEVAFAPSNKNSSYAADYTDGKFTTQFYACYYDWNAESIPEDYRTDAKEIVYCYKTEFEIKVKFKMKSSGDESETFSDSVVNECYFRAAGKNLQPVYSKQRIVSRSPANLQAGSLKSAIKYVNAEYENFYNYNCTQVLSESADFTENADGVRESKTYRKLNKVKNSLFDNSSLYIAVRALGLTSDYSRTVSVFSAAGGGVASYKISGSSASLGNEERKNISAVMESKGLYYPVTKDADGNDTEDAGIATVAADINYADGNLQGTTQRVWYAAVTDAGNNVSRSAMVKLSIPLSYSLGTLNFTLKNVVSTLWNE